ncbi:DUF4116 domain-containing protein [Clostridioides difficile]|nr:DUF4116 domain-containing protein [Clostridioides difficile]
MCFVAIRKQPLTLRFVREQTEEMCLEAVTRNGMALEYVEDKTEIICIEALKQNKRSILYIEDKEKYLNMFDDIKYLNGLKQIKSKYKFIFSNIEYEEAKEEIRDVISIKENGKWLFTLCNSFFLDEMWEDMSKGVFLNKIYTEDRGYNAVHRVNLYRQVYIDFLEQFE